MGAGGRWLLGEAVAWDDEGELAKAASLSILSALLILTAASVSGHSARAEENCLAAPTGRAPAGSHWHYRTDPVKQTKCWYLRTEGEPAQTTAATDGSEPAGAAAKPPAAAAARPAAEPKPAADQAGSNAHQRRPHQTAHAASSGKPAQASPQIKIKLLRITGSQRPSPPTVRRLGPILPRKQPVAAWRGPILRARR